MKFLLGLALFISTNAFALNICSFEDLYTLQDAFNGRQIKPYKISKDFKKFTALEKSLIQKTVSLQEWRGKLTVEESVEVFMDLSEGATGSLAGEIRYYLIDGKRVTELAYFPGDNDYGAFFSEGNKLLASIEDGEINCSPSKN